MFIGPRGASTKLLYCFENSIGLNCLVRKYRNAVAMLIDSPRQFGRINDIKRDIRRVIQINTLVEDHRIAWGSRASCVCRIEITAVVTHVIKQTVSDWRTARHESQK